ncbi:MAG: class I SAM-dependent methyltransferase [Chloroflexota bacterium]
MPVSQPTPVIDYEGSHYQTDFWVDQGREYEDRIERLILQRLLPVSGHRLIEIGAGFGRLAQLYDGYEEIILFDYSRSLLEEAVQKWGGDPRFVFVAGNIYDLPFASGVIDTLVMVRVMHHLVNVPQALEQLYRVLHKDSYAVLEYANKRNLKSILRWVIGKQSWSPFDKMPYEFVELNFDFHPEWMQEQICEIGFTTRQRHAVSHFRLPLLKRLIPTGFLAQLDNLISLPSGLYPISPSVFLQTQVKGNGNHLSGNSQNDLVGIFRCPNCSAETLDYNGDTLLHCSQCSISYRQEGRIWDFKVRG